MYTMKQMADEMGISKQTIYRFVKLNNMVGVEDKFQNKTILFTDEQFDFIKKNINLTNHHTKTRQSQSSATNNIQFGEDVIALQHEIELLKLELNLKNELIANQKFTIDLLSKAQPDSIKFSPNKLYTNDIVDKAVEIKDKVTDVIPGVKKAINQNPHPLVEQFLIDKGLTIEQVVSDQESEQFNIQVAENRLSAKERSEFKKDLAKVLGHKDTSSTGRTFRTFIKKVLANKE